MNTRDPEALRTAFYESIEPLSMAPLWLRLKGLVRREPAPGDAHHWGYGKVRPYLMESAQHITAEEAERRVLILENPAFKGASRITPTLFAGLQLIMPGEIAPAHRHTQSALRFIIEGGGAYTTIDDEKIVMHPGDFIVTPAWRWHTHGNETEGPMVWLDGLDIPMVQGFNTSFREDHDAWQPPEARFGGLIYFPYAKARAALDAMASAGTPDPHLGYVMRYTDPVDGGWAMPTIASMIRSLPPGLTTKPYRSTDSMVFCCVEGRGRIEVGGRTIEMNPHDVAVVPGWSSYTLSADGPWTLFSYSDRAAQEKLGFFREQRL